MRHLKRHNHRNLDNTSDCAILLAPSRLVDNLLDSTLLDGVGVGRALSQESANDGLGVGIVTGEEILADKVAVSLIKLACRFVLIDNNTLGITHRNGAIHILVPSKIFHIIFGLGFSFVLGISLRSNYLGIAIIAHILLKICTTGSRNCKLVTTVVLDSRRVPFDPHKADIMTLIDP